MSETRTALVTGANKGIGYEVAAGLGALGFAVGVGSRDARRGQEAVEKLRADGVDAFAVPLDVTDDASVEAAVGLLRERGGRLDVLVNNAGIFGQQPQLPSQTGADAIRHVFETNLVGVARVTNAVLPMLLRSPSPRIVNVTSSMGSLTRQVEYGPSGMIGPIAAAYSPSKAALNMLTLQYARELAGTDVLVNVCCPGLTATDFTGHAGDRTPAQGAAIAIRLATLPDGGPTGRFCEDAGEVPW